MAFFRELAPTMQALLGTLFTWGMTALGAALVFFFRRINKIILNAMLGFASGVMIAASFWSLLQPAIVMAEDIGQIPYLVAALGFLAGGGFLMLVDHLLPHMHAGLGKSGEVHGPKTNLRRSILLVLAITLHNIPEGLAVGVAFGAAAAGVEGADLSGAFALALGIGLQNFPEGAAVSIPLRRDGMSRRKAFFYGQISGIVEPISAVIGVIAVQAFRHILPFALAFAAGAMIYVVVEELIPEARRQETDDQRVTADVATIGVMLGFTVMMILDVALG
jgi:ZIP family zinc transporter